LVIRSEKLEIISEYMDEWRKSAAASDLKSEALIGRESSNLSSSTHLKERYGSLAQLVEPFAHNEAYLGSNPRGSISTRGNMDKETTNLILHEINRFISKSVELWLRGFPTTQRPSYKFEELKELTDDRFIITRNIYGESLASLDDQNIGKAYFYTGQNDVDGNITPIDNDDYDIHIEFYREGELTKGFNVPFEVKVYMYQILKNILLKDITKSKYKFEKLEFNGFYEK
jgi:hypothetical protein